MFMSSKSFIFLSDSAIKALRRFILSSIIEILRSALAFKSITILFISDFAFSITSSVVKSFLKFRKNTIHARMLNIIRKESKKATLYLVISMCCPR